MGHIAQHGPVGPNGLAPCCLTMTTTQIDNKLQLLNDGKWFGSYYKFYSINVPK